eukprot:jgi/Galph1/2128/GphlegSOOS_G823.1
MVMSSFVYLLLVTYNTLENFYRVGRPWVEDWWMYGGYILFSNLLRIAIFIYKGSLYKRFFFEAGHVFYTVCFYLVFTHILKKYHLRILFFSMLYVFSSWLLFMAKGKKHRLCSLPTVATCLEPLVQGIEDNFIKFTLLYNLSDAYFLVELARVNVGSVWGLELMQRYRSWSYPFLMIRIFLELVKILYAASIVGALEKQKTK